MRFPRYALCTLAAAMALPSVAAAQYGPGMGGGMQPMGPGGGQPGMPGQGQQGKEEEGPAEQAPEKKGQEFALQPLPAWPDENEKTTYVFSLHGYLRGRSFLFHNFNLGIMPPSVSNSLASPFYTPYSETNAGLPGTCAANAGNKVPSAAPNCDTTLYSADMRLRLEPSIAYKDTITINMQLDVFDNMVLGSSADGYTVNSMATPGNVPLQAYSRTQEAPTAGINAFRNSVTFKRAWATVKTPIGQLQIGRQPNAWGMGMLANKGDCLDCDYGQNVDRALWAIKGFDHVFAFFWDWASSGPTTRLYQPQVLDGPDYAADPTVGVSQWGVAFFRRDKDEDVQYRISQGDTVVNYGLYALYRKQDWDVTPPVSASKGTDPTTLGSSVTQRGAWAFIPDLWFRLDWSLLRFETEMAFIGGSVDNVSDIFPSVKGGLNIVEFGGVARLNIKLLKETLHLIGEVGYASGDSSEDLNANINFRQAVPVPYTGMTVSRFMFDPDFHVDYILFRRLMGTVYNATYFKPTVTYDLVNDQQQGLKGTASVIYSLANNAVATPGNGHNLGLEIDASLEYYNKKEGFTAGIYYGVLFPFNALAPITDIYLQNGHGTAADPNLDTAQTLQGRVYVVF